LSSARPVARRRQYRSTRPGFDLAAHPLRALWARPGGPAASLAWAAHQLTGLGWLRAVGRQQRTWNRSAIWRLEGRSGVAWLKQVPPMFAHEPSVLRWLAGVAPRLVPAVLAGDDRTGRMLLAHAPGEDRYFAGATELADLIDDLHYIQRAAVAHIGSLRAAVCRISGGRCWRGSSVRPSGGTARRWDRTGMRRCGCWWSVSGRGSPRSTPVACPTPWHTATFMPATPVAMATTER
jgi:hypothetical protein